MNARVVIDALDDPTTTEPQRLVAFLDHIKGVLTENDAAIATLIAIREMNDKKAVVLQVAHVNDAASRARVRDSFSETDPKELFRILRSMTVCGLSSFCVGAAANLRQGRAFINEVDDAKRFIVFRIIAWADEPNASQHVTCCLGVGSGCKVCSASNAVTLKVCSACRSSYYCTTACQHADWKAHKTRCRAFAAEQMGVPVAPKPRSV
jgi:hypothetical protein